MTKLVRLAMLLLAATLGGCSALSAGGMTSAPPSPAALHRLEQVRESYLAGKYGDVIRTVAISNDLAGAPPELRIEALKLQAFSYCVTGYRMLCEDDFARILILDPSFELAPAEIGHPVWGPAFQRAKARQGS